MRTSAENFLFSPIVICGLLVQGWMKDEEVCVGSVRCFARSRRQSLSFAKPWSKSSQINNLT
jgi:hypothetical protein